MKKLIKAPMQSSLDDHSTEGIDILIGDSSLAAKSVIYIFLLLLVSLLAWSFFGKADMIVTAEGKIEPRLYMQQVYSPVGGEVIGIYASEGSILKKGEIIARIKANDAVRAASEAANAKISLEKAEMELKLFEQKKILNDNEIKNLEDKISKIELDYQLFLTNAEKNLPSIHAHKLEKARLKLKQMAKERDLKKEFYEKYERLFKLKNGGISEKELKEKEEQYLKAQMAYDEAQIDLENLPSEFSNEKTQYVKRARDTHSELAQLRFQKVSKIVQMDTEEKKLKIQHKAAQAAWEAASVITYDDLDEDSYLQVRAPVDGEVTFVSSRQRGEKIKPDVPLAAIAPVNTEKVLTIRIKDLDRGLLKTGQPVRIRFTAFPYQRHGFISGILEYVSPDALSTQDVEHFYEGRVGIDQDFVDGDYGKKRIRYGMTANAEIAVQKRRLIDWVLDPFRKLSRRLS